MSRFGQTGTGDWPVLLDLDRVAQVRRMAAWTCGVPTIFPGLSVSSFLDEAGIGSIRGIGVGQGRLLSIASCTARVDYRPVSGESDTAHTASLMVQVEGTTQVRQGGRQCVLGPGDLSLVDGSEDWQLEIRDSFSRFLVMQIPLAAVARHPCFHDMKAAALDLRHEGNLLVRNLMLMCMDAVARLDVCGRATLYSAVHHLLGMLSPTSARTHLSLAERRCRMALARIESDLGNSALSASSIAQSLHVSRRRLDLLFKRSTGSPVSEWIRRRRLEEAANRLKDPACAPRSITDIAFSLGFESIAHFARAFRKQYGCTPSQWRQGRAVGAVLPRQS